MTKIVLLLCIALYIPDLYSQINTEPFNSPTYHIKEHEIIEHDSIKIKGTPYIYPSFTEGKVFFTSVNETKMYHLNLNIFKDELEFIQDNKKYSVTNPELIDKIIINQDTIRYLSYKDKNSISKGYFILITSDKTRLLKREVSKLVQPRKARNLYDVDEPGKFQRLNPTYYVAKQNSPAVLLKSSKSFIEIFNNDQELKAFIKEEKINFNSENDLKKLLHYVNHQNIN